MLEWLKDHQAAMYWIGGASLLLFLATILAGPAILLRIPSDYFTHDRRPPTRASTHHPALRLAIRIAKNALGYLLILAGLAMLLLPGQGLLTLLIGFLMIDFPGKYGAEKWLIARTRLRNAINWLRHKRGRPPLEAPHPGPGAARSRRALRTP
jgi:hypothetical protein